jgi:hypothetical protein
LVVIVFTSELASEKECKNVTYRITFPQKFASEKNARMCRRITFPQKFASEKNARTCDVELHFLVFGSSVTSPGFAHVLMVTFYAIIFKA